MGECNNEGFLSLYFCDCFAGEAITFEPERNSGVFCRFSQGTAAVTA